MHVLHGITLEIAPQKINTHEYKISEFKEVTSKYLVLFALDLESRSGVYDVHPLHLYCILIYVSVKVELECIWIHLDPP